MSPFIEQFEKFKFELRHKSSLKIVTLGPVGTSSNCAALFLVDELSKVNSACNYSIDLKDNFNEVYEQLRCNKTDYALVPAAYERITDFFWCKDFSNVLSFIYETPKYGIISKNDYVFSKSIDVKIASCPAVEKIVNFIGKDIQENYNLELVRTFSTAQAAEFVANGITDIGVTNESSYEIYKGKGIKFITPRYSAKILWVIFKNNKLD